MSVKLNDFVEIEYTGRLKDSGVVFDTTDANVARENNLPKGQYGPVVVCIGQGMLLKGLEDQLVGKEPGCYKVELKAEQAFGKKDARLIRMIPARTFAQHKIQPVPGLQVNIDNMICTIIRSTGGRVMVDFNHPLAGKDVIYEVKINNIVTDKKEQLKAVFAMLLNIKPENIRVEGEKALVELKEKLPEQLVPELQKKIKELVGVDAEIKVLERKKPAEKHANKEENRPSTASQ